jgi:hypothetical protein
MPGINGIQPDEVTTLFASEIKQIRIVQEKQKMPAGCVREITRVHPAHFCQLQPEIADEGWSAAIAQEAIAEASACTCTRSARQHVNRRLTVLPANMIAHPNSADDAR